MAQDGDPDRELTWRDYLALLIAAFETYSLPFVVIIAVILAVTFIMRLR